MSVPVYMSIRRKMLILMIGALALALGSSGAILGVLIPAYHKEAATRQFAEAFGVVAALLETAEQRLEQGVGVLASDRDVVASVNMVSEYARRDAYQAIIFDPEKKAIARKLLSVLRVTPVDHLAAYDRDGELLAFALAGDEPVTGIVSYQDGGPVILLGRDDRWQAGSLPEPIESRLHSPAGGKPSEYRLVRQTVVLAATAPIERTYPDGSSRPVGHIAGGRTIDERFIAAAEREAHSQLEIGFGIGGSLYGIGGLLQLPPAALVPALERARHTTHLVDGPKYFLSAARLPVAGSEAAYLVIARPKDAVRTEIARTREVVFGTLLLAALLIIPVGTAAARRTVSRPIERLTAGVEALRQGHFDHRVEVASKDELGQLAHAFNAMAATIRRREEELRESEESYRRLIETSEEGVWVIDQRGNTLLANRKMAQMLATTPEAMAGRSIFEFIDEEHRPTAEYNLSRHTAGLHEQHDFLFRRADGRELWTIVSASPVIDRTGQVTGALAMVTDITERRHNESIDALLHDLNQRVLAGLAPEEVRQLACAELARRFGLPLVWIAERGQEGLPVVRAAGGPLGEHAGWTISEASGTDIESPEAQALRTGAPVRVRLDDGDAAWQMRGRQLGCADIAAFPMLSADEPLGTLVLCAGHPDLLDEPAIRRFEKFANRLTLALVLAGDQARLRLQSAAMDAAANAIIITTPEGRIEWVNRAFTRITGFSLEEVTGQRPALLQSGQQSEDYYRAMWNAILRGEAWQGELINRRKDGTLYTVEQTVAPLTDVQGRITHFIAIQEDITARKEAEAHVRYMEQYDTLTGLPNRMLLLDRLNQALTRARRSRRTVALIQLDLDRFKNINDSLGPSQGDRLLRTVADLLRTAVRSGDTVSRQGGDEFTLLLDNLQDGEQAAAIAHKISQRFTRPFDLDGNELFVTCSMGIALFPTDASSADGLLRDADAAMFRAKEMGRNTYRFFTADLNERAVARLKLESGLRRALERDELVLFYQPQREVAGERIIAAEALVRWRHPELGLLGPGEFIPLAEEIGLIIPLGKLVLRSACRQAKAWQAAGHPLRVAVNVSAVQLKREDIADEVAEVLHSSGLDPALLELEVTESELMDDPQRVIRILERLKAMGVQIAIDDFGTGYSSFAQLRSLPVDRLKIDRSFVHDLASAGGSAVAAAIINLAHSLRLKVIAEGVETAEQLAFLAHHGCDEIQGYYISKPLPVDDFERLVSSRTAAPLPQP